MIRQFLWELTVVIIALVVWYFLGKEDKEIK
jgi:hypothetical protein